MKIMSLVLVVLLTGCCQVMDRDSFVRVVHEKDLKMVTSLWYLGSIDGTDVFVLRTLTEEQRLEVKPPVVESNFSMRFVGDKRCEWKLIKSESDWEIKHLSTPDTFLFDELLTVTNAEYIVIENGRRTKLAVTNGEHIVIENGGGTVLK